MYEIESIFLNHPVCYTSVLLGHNVATTSLGCRVFTFLIFAVCSRNTNRRIRGHGTSWFVHRSLSLSLSLSLSFTFYTLVNTPFVQITVSKKRWVTNLANYTSVSEALHTCTPPNRYYWPFSCKYRHFCLQTYINILLTKSLKKCQWKVLCFVGFSLNNP